MTGRRRDGRCAQKVTHIQEASGYASVTRPARCTTAADFSVRQESPWRVQVIAERTLARLCLCVCARVCVPTPLYERCGMDGGTTSERTQTHTGMSGW